MSTTIGELKFNTNSFDPKYYLGTRDNTFRKPVAENTADQVVLKNQKLSQKRKSLTTLAVLSAIVGATALAVAIKITSFMRRIKIPKTYKEMAIEVFNKYLDKPLSSKATAEELKAAYRTLVKKFHPDTVTGQNGAAEEIFKEISIAYKNFTNPKVDVKQFVKNS